MKIVPSLAPIFPLHVICRKYSSLLVKNLLYTNLFVTRSWLLKDHIEPTWQQVLSVYIDILCSRTICENLWVLTGGFSPCPRPPPAPCTSDNHNCFQAQHLEPHLVSLLESKLASLFTNKGLTLYWTAVAVSSADRLAFLDGGKEADMLLFLALVSISQMSTLCKLNFCPRTWSKRWH